MCQNCLGSLFVFIYKIKCIAETLRYHRRLNRKGVVTKKKKEEKIQTPDCHCSSIVLNFPIVQYEHKGEKSPD